MFEMNVYFLPLGYEFLYSVIPVILFRSSRPSLFGDVLLVLEEVSSSLAFLSVFSVKYFEIHCQEHQHC